MYSLTKNIHVFVQARVCKGLQGQKVLLYLLTINSGGTIRYSMLPKFDQSCLIRTKMMTYVNDNFSRVYATPGPTSPLNSSNYVTVYFQNILLSACN